MAVVVYPLKWQQQMIWNPTSGSCRGKIYLYQISFVFVFAFVIVFAFVFVFVLWIQDGGVPFEVADDDMEPDVWGLSWQNIFVSNCKMYLS